MLDIKFLRENTELMKKVIENKRIGLDLDELLKIDSELLELGKELQELQTQRNVTSKKIPTASPDERPALIEAGKEIGNKIKDIQPRVSELEESLKQLMYLVPQIPSSKAPLGKDDSDNVEVKKHGDLPKFDFEPLDHVQILEKQNWAEFEKVAKVCGSRSYSLRNEMVLLEMALHRMALDKLLDKGFTLVSAPSMAREQALFGTGHFPTGRDQAYYVPEHDIYLSGTAEVQLNSFHMDEILDEKDLPILYAGYSPCFRSEAGSYGRDVRGLIRVHQFNKTEQYIICKNDEAESEKWHQMLLTTAEEICQELNLPYRIVECCTGDMGAGKHRMFDIECWVPSESKYRETHSCSALHDWQSRRTNTRYRDSEGKVQFVHTLNNTAVATPRILVPFLENHQQKDGTIFVPEKLRPYLSGRTVLGKA
ncbi:serine--tRNA ligase [Bacteriovorax sp. Seq25_V]|uniref:serine--tRNA ligase n=1 Tax=Bacteriovorax sp. Seq25_V TaxID=1201288 RepID=UPI00038A305C|nr:serine--tRNA ligase [Bacteriovorax sp. Seq25_V]EQC45525.1 serine--tRNA ligase [Bacteriovorax sp. Seq25_V]